MVKFLSVVVLVVDDAGIRAVERESHAPVPADPDRPMLGQIAFQRMQLPAGYVHVLRGARLIKLCQLALQPSSVGRLNPCLAAAAEERLKPLVYEALDHGESV